MKSIKFILVALIAAFTLSTTSVYAQEDGNRDANGYVVRGPYLTNGGGANWFFGVGGGFNTSLAKGVTPLAEFTPENNWAAEAFIGKWFTPSVGARVGYKGVMNNFGYNTNLYESAIYPNGEQVRFGYAHIDGMWNISNALSGYKETRFWDFVPYAGAGYLGINNGSTDNKFAVSVGLYNKFRLSNTVNLFLDVNLIGTENSLALTNVADGTPVIDGTVPVIQQPLYLPTATFGITFNLGKKKNFDRYSSVAPVPVVYPFTEQDYYTLKAKAEQLEKDNANLRENLENCINTPKGTVVVKDTVVAITPLRLYFKINESVLSNQEQVHLGEWVSNNAIADKDVIIIVTGGADKKTGTRDYNLKLSEKRALYVEDLLVKAGVSVDRLNTVVAEPGTLNDVNELNRVVIVEAK